jgi:hypothetical protein
MAALTQARMTRETRSKTRQLSLAAGQKVFAGGRACFDTSVQAVVKAVSGSATLVGIGEFAENVDNSAGGSAVGVLVSLDHEVVTRWYDNATGGAAIGASQLYTDLCYFLDDHTVTNSASGNSKAGRVWSFDTTNGVEIEAGPRPDL